MKHRNKILLLIIMLFALTALILFWCWYDSHVDRSGWLSENGRKYYLDFHGKPVYGWLELDGTQYYLDENAGAVTGWSEIGEERYYFDEDGVLQTGWLEKPEGRYYLNESGNPLFGWQVLSGQTYYFLENGTAAVSWLALDGERYYFNAQGCMTTGWLEQPEGRYYFAQDGRACTGQLSLTEGVFYLDDDGIMTSGWVDLPSGRHYFAPTMQTGWQEIDGKIYCFDENGVMRTGWTDRDEYRYYLTEDGAVTGPAEIDGRTCYFTPKGIYVLLINYNNLVPLDMMPDLVPFKDNMWVASIIEPHLRQMLKDCRETGVSCQMNCGYRSYESQALLSSSKNAVPYTVASPGKSEHQTGLSVDIVCTPETGWLQEHCWEYGFIVRYTEEKQSITHIANEFWHYRYVGREVSMDMKDTGLCLEEYLGAA